MKLIEINFLKYKTRIVSALCGTLPSEINPQTLMVRETSKDRMKSKRVDLVYAPISSISQTQGDVKLQWNIYALTRKEDYWDHIR
jgi:hypothetical protein